METSNHTKEGRRSGMVREVVVPIGSLIVALAGIMLSFYSLNTQILLQESRVKYAGYGALMSEFRMAFYSAAGGQSQPMWDHINKAWAEYYPLETFVTVGQREQLRHSIVEVVGSCERALWDHSNSAALEEAQSTFSDRHKKLGEKLEEHLGLRKR